MLFLYYVFWYCFCTICYPCDDHGCGECLGNVFCFVVHILLLLSSKILIKLKKKMNTTLFSPLLKSNNIMDCSRNSFWISKYFGRSNHLKFPSSWHVIASRTPITSFCFCFKFVLNFCILNYSVTLHDLSSRLMSLVTSLHLVDVLTSPTLWNSLTCTQWIEYSCHSRCTKEWCGFRGSSICSAWLWLFLWLILTIHKK